MKNQAHHSTVKDASWQAIVSRYNQPDLRKSLWQLLNSVVPYVLLWYAMLLSLPYSYWLTLVLAVLASLFLVRIFIIFHDCGHQSFFRSKWANDGVGMLMGILVLTPYRKWHRQHHTHHATAGNLDKRGTGDVWTMTVEEYRTSSTWRRMLYRVFRNPFVLFGLGPLVVVFGTNRFTTRHLSRAEKRNMYFTNGMVLLMAATVGALAGIKAYLLIQVPVILLSHSIGVWLFYVQHQFEEVAWVRDEDWDHRTAAIQGSSFLKLPAVLQWFSGNIGFHHVHHLSPRIPNYHLSRCHHENELFRAVKPLSWYASFKALKQHLWHEASGRIVGFGELKAL